MKYWVIWGAGVALNLLLVTLWLLLVPAAKVFEMVTDASIALSRRGFDIRWPRP